MIDLILLVSCSADKFLMSLFLSLIAWSKLFRHKLFFISNGLCFNVTPSNEFWKNVCVFTHSFKKLISSFDFSKLLKVDPRVEKTEVFKKDWNFVNRLILRVAKWKNVIFYYARKKQRSFLIFTNEMFFYSAELFVCAVNFKFYLNIFIFLNRYTNQTSKEQYLN